MDLRRARTTPLSSQSFSKKKKSVSTKVYDLPPYVPDPRDDEDSLAPPAELRQGAYELCRETFERRQAGLEEVRRRIAEHEQKATQRDADFSRVDDAMIMIFLRAKKLSVESAWKKCLNFAKAQYEHNWLKQVDVGFVEELFASGCFQILPVVDESGRLILSMNFEALSLLTERIKGESRKLLVGIFGMLETIMTDVRAQVYGVVVVSDLGKCRLKTFGFLSMAEYLLSLDLCQNCYPIKARGMYLVREPWFVKGMFGVMRPFMSSSAKEGLICFGDEVQKVARYLPKEALLAGMGGNLTVEEVQKTAKLWVEKVRTRFDTVNGVVTATTA